MERVREFTYPSADGEHQIYATVWLPEGEPKAVVQIVHGVAEYVGRYADFAAFLNERGYVVCGEDHLGHGRTGAQDGKFGYFGKYDGWTLVTADIRTLRQRMGEEFSGLPYFLLGHSMGSFLTRTYLCRYPGEVSGAILSGTGQESAFLVSLGKAVASLVGHVRGMDKVSKLVNNLSLGAYNRKFAPNRTSADWISRDEAVVDAYLKDPYCTFMPTAGMYRDMLGGLQYIASRQALSRLDVDTSIGLFSGDADPVGGMGKGVEKVYEMYRKAGVRDLKLKLYPGGRHEIINETNKQEVYADMLAWLEEHMP
ncbi:MAG: alpha/beta hydrolase [Oscillospiraceae bacterium]|nr:alpha/beta hydrolase [Oscillospiraceae bacterium]